MSIETRDQELVNLLIRGELVGEEKASFESRLKTDTDLLEYYNQIKELTLGITLDALQQKKNLLEKWDDEIESKKALPVITNTTSSRINSFFRVVAIAASLGIVGLLFRHQYDVSKRNQLFEQYFEPPQRPITFRGELNKVQECYTFYDRRMWSEYIDCIEGLPDNHQDHKLYLLAAHLALKDIERSKDLLEELKSTSITEAIFEKQTLLIELLEGKSNIDSLRIALSKYQ